MAKHTELRLSGSGGQGLILAGIILADAAIRDGINAIQTQSYGPEARGGASKAEVLIADEEIDFPKVTTPDLVLALTQEACDKYVASIKEGGIVIVNKGITVPSSINAKVYELPIMETAKTKVGKGIVANIVALGAIVELTQLVSKENLENAILSRVPKGTEALNRLALTEGYNMVK